MSENFLGYDPIALYSWLKSIDRSIATLIQVSVTSTS